MEGELSQFRAIPLFARCLLIKKKKIWPRATLRGAATLDSFFTPRQRVWERVRNRV